MRGQDPRKEQLVPRLLSDRIRSKEQRVRRELQEFRHDIFRPALNRDIHDGRVGRRIQVHFRDERSGRACHRRE